MTDAEWREDILQRVKGIEVSLQGLPCKNHEKDLEKLKANSQYQRGWRSGAFWGISAISAVGGGGVVGLLFKMFAR